MQMSSKFPLFFWLLKKKKNQSFKSEAGIYEARLLLAAGPADVNSHAKRGQGSVSVICSGKACRIFTELCDPLGAFLFVCDQRQNGMETLEVAFAEYWALSLWACGARGWGPPCRTLSLPPWPPLHPTCAPRGKELLA